MKRSERAIVKKILRAPFFWIAGDKLILSRKNCDSLGIKLPSPDYFAKNPAIIFSETNPYAHPALRVGNSVIHGKGLFSMDELPAGMEILRIPALVSQGGDETHSESVLKCVHAVLDALNQGCHPEKASAESLSNLWENILKHTEENVLSLMDRNWKPLSPRIAESLVTKKYQPLFQLVAKHGKLGFSPNEIAGKFEFNRFDVTRQKKKYCAVFPEASLFNHDCAPNVEIEIITPSGFGMASAASSSSTCVLIARTSRKVLSSEELLVSYLGSEVMPITEKGDRLRRRWKFQCTCRGCRFRLMRAMAVLFAVLGTANWYLLQRYFLRTA